MYCTPPVTLKARKDHVCSSCGEKIPVGELYRRWRSYCYGDAGTNRMHEECYEMHTDDAGSGTWEYAPYSYERPTKPSTERGE